MKKQEEQVLPVPNPNMLGRMEFIGFYFGYSVYKNADGYLEGYRSTVAAKNDLSRQAMSHAATNIKRVVTTAKTIDEFKKQVKGKKYVPAPYDPYQDPKQLRIE